MTCKLAASDEIEDTAPSSELTHNTGDCFPQSCWYSEIPKNICIKKQIRHDYQGKNSHASVTPFQNLSETVSKSTFRTYNYTIPLSWHIGVEFVEFGSVEWNWAMAISKVRAGVGIEHCTVLKMLDMKVNVVIITNSTLHEYYCLKHDNMWYKTNNIDFH